LHALSLSLSIMTLHCIARSDVAIARNLCENWTTKG
jgi:hypothetical protein